MGIIINLFQIKQVILVLCLRIRVGRSMAKKKKYSKEELKLPEFKYEIFSRFWILGRGGSWFWFCLCGLDWLYRDQSNGFPMR